MNLDIRRSATMLFSDPADHYSHRVRMVLAEKGISVDTVDVKPSAVPEELYEINPYGSLPTLLDRDLVLYNSSVIMEYLDERFPHPPLLPVYPIARGRSRLLLFRVEHDWASKVDLLKAGKGRKTVLARTHAELRESIINAAPIFMDKTFFMSDEFSLVDCCVAPILWRIDLMKIKLPVRQTRGIHRYMKEVFNRESFLRSLTDDEQDMHT